MTRLTVPRRRSPLDQPLGRYAINPGHQLGSGLVSCFAFTEVGQSEVVDPISGMVVPASGGAGAIAPIATPRSGVQYAAQNTATGQAYTTAAPPASLLLPTVTMVARIGFFGAGAAYSGICGMDWGTGGASPYNCYNLARQGSGSDLLAAWNNAGSQNTLSASLATGVEASVALVVTSGLQQLWINGALAASATVSGSISYSGSNYCVMGQVAASGQRFNGWISQLLVYNRVLSGAEIQHLYLEPWAMVAPQRRLFVGGSSTAWIKSSSETVGASDAGNRDAAYQRQQAETVSTSDAVAGIRGLVRSIAEAVSAVDAALRSAVYGRAASETVATSDAQARQLAMSRQESETVSTSDTATGIRGLLRSINETIGITDAPSRFVAYLRSAPETIGISDALSRIAAYGRSITETVASSDAVSRIHGLFASIAETESVLDSVIRQAVMGRTATETVGISDTPGSVKGLVRQITETIATSDTVSRAAGYLRSIAETISIADIVSYIYTPYPYPRLLQKGAGSTSAVTSVTISATKAGSLFYVALSDVGSGGSGTNPKFGSTSFSLATNIYWGGSSTYEHATYFLLPTAGQTSLTIPANVAYAYEEWSPGTGTWATSGLTQPPLDKHVNNAPGTQGTSASSGSSGTLTSANEIAIGAASAYDVITGTHSGWSLDENWSGGVVPLAVSTVSAASTTALTDTFTIKTSQYWVCSLCTFEFIPNTSHIVAIVETIASSDAVTRLAGYGRSMAEAVSALDAVLSPVAHFARMVETIATTDAPQAVRGVLRTIAETIGINDAAQRQAQMQRQEAEAIQSSDSPNRLVQMARSIAEAVSVADVPFAGHLIEIAIAEAVGAVDSVQRSVGYLRSIAETVSVSDLMETGRHWIVSIAETISTLDVMSIPRQIVITISDALPAFVDFNQQAVQTITESLPTFTDTATMVRQVYRTCADFLPTPTEVVTMVHGIFRSAGKRF